MVVAILYCDMKIQLVDIADAGKTHKRHMGIKAKEKDELEQHVLGALGDTVIVNELVAYMRSLAGATLGSVLSMLKQIGGVSLFH